ncbi:MAG: hypothetical protein E7172_06275 [Firmicutes bacterium]|nr:hypothetical protein [Bacillota bacterium]
MRDLRPVPIGVDNFNELIEGNYVYVDKTDLIEDILKRGAKVNLFPRPRRFGKTLTISMLDNYFNVKKKDENKNLFKGLKISKSDKDIRQEQGKYPVISLNLKGVKDSSWEKEYSKIIEFISTLYQQNIEVIELLNDKEKKYYNDIIDEVASETDYQLSLKKLSQYLMRYYKQPVIILIDEYDAPIENGFLNGFYDEVINFMRNFFGEALKTNDYLKFACMTGILRVSKESIFSGLNNPKIYSILDEQYSEYFGFVLNEVDALLEEYGVENKEEVKAWYDGYNFGGTEIYNPWSILNCIADKNIKPYWVNTGGTGLLEDMLKNASSDVKNDLEDLIKGNTVDCFVNESVVYSEINGSRENILNFMLMCGYLTAAEQFREDKKIIARLRIPNKEVEIAFETIVQRWFEQSRTRLEIQDLQKAILRNDKELAEIILNQLMEKSMSYFENVENFYHGFVLGLLVDLGDKYIVKSNREGGYGRYDMKIEKKDGSVGVIMEFKTVKDEDKMEEMANVALEQIEKNKYYLDMKERGITNILKYGVAFNNKKAVLR